MSVLKYFKNIPRSPPIRRQALSVIFSSSNSQRDPWQKKGACRPPNGRQGPVAHPRGDRPLSPVGGRQALFFQGPRCEFEEKKLHLGPVALWGATGVIFKIFQN